MRDVIYCNQCGAQNRASSLQCRTCGEVLRVPDIPTQPSTALGVDATSQSTPSTSDPAIGAFLIVRNGPVAGAQFWLDASFHQVGREPASDVFLDDVTVSRRHAEIRRVGRHYVVRDLGSLNGTYVNGTRIDEHTLYDGDELQFGRFRVAFVASR